MKTPKTHSVVKTYRYNFKLMRFETKYYDSGWEIHHQQPTLLHLLNVYGHLLDWKVNGKIPSVLGFQSNAPFNFGWSVRRLSNPGKDVGMIGCEHINKLAAEKRFMLLAEKLDYDVTND